MTSPPGNAFPWPAGKGAVVSLKEPPGFPHPKPFPAASILAMAGGCNFGSMGKGCCWGSWAGSHLFGVGSQSKPPDYCREGK